MNSLKYDYDPSVDVATIEGRKFSGEFLRFLAGNPPVGMLFRVVEAPEGDLAIEAVYEAK